MNTITALICGLTVAICLAPTGAEKCTYNGAKIPPGTHTIDCVNVTCNKDGTTTEDTCPHIEIRCLDGYQLGYRPQNNSLPYPDCCGRPICVKKTEACD